MPEPAPMTAAYAEMLAEENRRLLARLARSERALADYVKHVDGRGYHTDVHDFGGLRETHHDALALLGL